MGITVLGRGHVGDGLARLWQRAGHNVTALGRDGGDASDAEVIVVAVPSDAEVIVVAVPSDAIADAQLALYRLTGTLRRSGE